VEEGVNDDVHVVIMFYVIETYVAWEIGFGGKVVGGFLEVDSSGEG